MSAHKKVTQSESSAAEALRESEEKYRTLFETIDEGVCVIELVMDEHGHIADWIYREVNAAFRNQSGFDVEIGKRGSEIFPRIEKLWLDSLMRVHRTGQPERTEGYNADRRRWFTTQYSRIGGAGSPLLAAVFNDITERRAREERQKYLLELTDALHPLSDALEIQRAALRILGEHLKVDRTFYAEVETDDEHFAVVDNYVRGDFPAMMERFSLRDFGQALSSQRASEALVLPDVRAANEAGEHFAAYLALGVQAIIVVPLYKDGRRAASLAVHHGSPREWTPEETGLVNETAERMWAAIERARAERLLQESESRLHSIVNLVPDFLWDSEPNGSTNWYNQRWLEYTGQSFEEAISWGWLDVIHPEDRAASARRYREAVENGAMLRHEHRIRRYDGEYRWFIVNVFPFKDENGQVLKIYGAATDIHESKTMRESAARLQKAIQIETVGVLFFDIEGNFLDANDAFLRQIGYTRPEFERRQLKFEDVTLPEWMPRTRESLEELKATGRFAPYEKQLIRPDGARSWALCAGTQLSENEGVEYVVDVTELKKLEEAVRQSEERLRLATEAGGLGTWQWNLKTGEVFWNEQHFILFGMEPRPNPLMAEEFFRHVHPDDRERITRNLQQAILEKTIFHSDFRAVLRTGETRWMSGYGRVVAETDDGDAVKMSGVMLDITQQREVEEKLRASEDRFRTLSDAVPQIIWTNNSDGTANYFNSRWFEYSGLSPQEPHGLGWQEIVHPDDAPASVERWNAALANGEIFDTEYRLRGGNGVYRWFIGRNVPLKDEAGTILSWFGSATDTEDFKRAEAALREGEERFRAFIEGVEDYAIFMADTGGTLVTWNSGVQRVLGYDEDSWLKQNVAMIFTPEDRARGEVEREMKTAAREGRALDERWHLRQSGERFYASGVLIALRDESQNLTGYAKIMRDMTQRKRMEDELRRAHDELESRVVERTRELENQTEELRQSEAARGLLLQRAVNAQEDERRRISRELHDQMGQQLSALLMGLRALPAASEPEGDWRVGAQQIERLQNIAEDLIDRAHSLAWQTRPAILDTIGLQVALEQGVREWSRQSGVAGDFIARGLGSRRLSETLETTFYRVVLEALANVQRHAQAQSVSVSLERKGDTISAIIEDDGVGFSVETRADILRTGRLGLLGMRERMELVGGSLEIESAPGGGTTVYARAKV